MLPSLVVPLLQLLQLIARAREREKGVAQESLGAPGQGACMIDRAEEPGEEPKIDPLGLAPNYTCIYNNHMALKLVPLRAFKI